MVGALITFLVCAAIAAGGRALLARWLDALDPAAAWGVGGLYGLGILGTLSLFVGLLPGGFDWGVALPIGLAIAGGALGWRRREELRAAKPQGSEWAFAGALGLALLFALVAALAPSDMSDWDSLAYHLALPKLWLEAGRIEYVSFIHHSNFPAAIDLLFVWGTKWGGQAGAKAFSVAILTFGMAAVFGLARQRYGGRAGWWGALALASMPVVLWESGTAYIDVGHGLFAGMGLWFAGKALEEPDAAGWRWLAALGLGLGMGSKYTGLQTFAVAVAILGTGMLLARRPAQGVRAKLLVALVALVVAAPWYVKNAAWTGNPVFPFFYEQFGGRNWSQVQADVYRDEQQTFGLGRTEGGRDWSQFGGAVLGLVVEPLPYINRGQYPLGTLGAAWLAAAFAWAFAGRRRGRTVEGAVLAGVALSLVMWFALSQQSRYIVTLGVPLAAMAGGAVARLRAGPVLAAVVALQAAYSLWLIKTLVVDDRLPVVVGKESGEEFIARRVPLGAAAAAIDEAVGPTGRVALYDEVFGSLLNVPYFWANPGHSSEIPYAKLATGAAYAAEMRRQGFTHAYVSVSPLVADPAFVPRWLASMGLGEAEPLGAREREDLLGQFQTRWKILLADAVREGELQLVGQYRSGLLFGIGD